MGLLKNPELNRVQYWALAYYLTSRKRDFNAAQEKLTLDLMAFLNPQAYQAIMADPEDDPDFMDMSIPPDFGEFESIIDKINKGGTMRSEIIQGDEDGWI